MDDERPVGPDLPPDENHKDESVSELAGFTLDDSDELKGRVHRSINRRMLASHSLEFSLGVLFQTFWDYLKSIIEAFPQAEERDEEKRDG